MLKKKRTTKPKVSEVALFDWVPGHRWVILIYSGRKVSRIDPGILRKVGVLGKDDVLYRLYKEGKLTGQALADAESVYRNLEF